MLDPKVIQTVKSTVPVLQAGGEQLTRHFYERMFRCNPEVASLFNSANQASGTQQRTLAAAICAYAANIDNLDALKGAVKLIASKHTSLQIQPKHYPIVGENLLASIKEVLGDAASDEIVDAWGKAYSFLADVLIEHEQSLYNAQNSMLGGWNGFRSFKVVRKVRESHVVTSFYLVPEDGAPIPSFRSGQYITVRVPCEETQTTMRNYSLSNMPGEDYFRISVKREEGGQGCPSGYVSNLLHKELDVGSTIEVAPPCGEFCIPQGADNSTPLVFLAGGVGVTPILSMLASALQENPDREIVFIQASLHEQNHAFLQEVEALCQKHKNLTRHYRYSEPAPADADRSLSESLSTGFVDAALLKKLVGATSADYYFCGPKPFMLNVYRILSSMGIPSDRINFEFFGPREEIEAIAGV